MIPNLPSCLWQKKRNPISGAQIFSQKNHSVFFSSAIANRSVFAIWKSQRFRDAKATTKGQNRFRFSHFFALFHTIPPGLSPSKQRVLAQ